MAEDSPGGGDGKLSVAVFSGATATIQNTEPLITSNQARIRQGLPPLSGRFDALRAQRLAAPVTVYIEAFTGHPLERDAAELYSAPDGYVGPDGVFSQSRTSPLDKPVHRAFLAPEDGLYLLPYMALQADGSAWDGECSHPDAEASGARQTFLPDASRLVEEIDRFGLDHAGHNNLLSARASFTYFRAAPSGGYTQGLAAADRSDHGSGDVAPETRGEDFFYYRPRHLAHDPAMQTLARVTNVVQSALQTGEYDGAVWLEGSPAVEETAYWLNLLIDTRIVICCNASQRPHGALSSDGDRNVVDSLTYLRSDAWADQDGADRVGVVLVQDQQVLSARDAQKGDARPGGFVTTGGHGGVVAAIGTDGVARPTYLPTKLHTHRSMVNVTRLPRTVSGVRRVDGRARMIDVAVKGEDGQLVGSAIPKVTLCKYSRYAMDDFSDDPAQEVEIVARVSRNLERFPLSGFVLEGNAPFGRSDESMTAALRLAVFSGMPVVAVGRGNADGITPPIAGGLFVAGSNLTANKARLLLMACLLRFGAVPAAVDPSQPTEVERDRVAAHVAQLQEVFYTH